MISYATIGSDNLSLSVPFFTDLLATRGVTKLFEASKGGTVFGKDGKIVLAVLTPYDRKAASVGNGSMIAFEMPDHAAVDAFHAKALELGAVDEGAPGQRFPGFYMAYFRDLEGNKFCACQLDLR